MSTFTMLSRYILLICIFAQAVFAQPKSVIYWGQESQGKEKPLRDYCSSGDYDVIVIGFAYMFPFAVNPSSSYPALNFASHCETPYDDANPQLLVCPTIGEDITFCQGLNVQILMSFGGGVGLYGFDSDDQATAFATQVWNMFMEGNDAQIVRPFGTAIIDGVDLDIEGGGTGGYIAFINKLRSYFATSSRKYYISSAPQCPFPDGRMGPGAGTALGGGWFDYVWVQFYNNYCGIHAPTQFNFNVWANWARTASVNPNVKVFIGAPASASAAAIGYIDLPSLSALHATVQATYSDVYGGIMLWDCSNSDNNNNFGHSVASFVHGSVAPTPALPSATGKAAMDTPSTTGSAPMATTGAIRHPTPVIPSAAATTGSTPMAPATTGSRHPTPVVPATTASPVLGSSTTGMKLASQRPSTPSTTGSSPVQMPSQPSNTPCTNGYMKCLTSETYHTCNRHSNQQKWRTFDHQQRRRTTVESFGPCVS